ncbi:MAG: hypothetical protein KTU85_07595 [Acidimicrobiia bacterium]|nr:hypothetical protein [Acidimicrobiia bacterium]MCY4456763.1 hypothetical protein [Acidimicrobiaceae bacterium]
MRVGGVVSPSFTAALAGWLEARLYVAAAFITTSAIIDSIESPLTVSPVDAGFAIWDGAWYRDLALHGYGAVGLEGGERFFPLWPLLGRFLGSATGSVDVALVVAANLLAFVAAMLLYRLTMQETEDADLARHVVRIFSLFPSAFVLVFGYSEALFIVLALGFALCVRARAWWAAAILGFLAGLTRPVGFFLSLLALVHFVSGQRRSLPALLTIASAPLGSLTFLAWAQFSRGGWRVPIEAQNALRGGFREPVTRIISAFVEGAGGDWGELLHALAAVVFVFLAVVGVRTLSVDLWVYAVPSTLILFAADNLNSLERYGLAVFPLVIAGGIVSYRPRLRRWLPTVSAVAMMSLTSLALSGAYVP